MDEGNRGIPRRKSLPHDPPVWVNPDREVYFVTVCCADRGGNALARDGVALPLMESVAFRNAARLWWCSSLVVMPDHIHGLFRFPDFNGDGSGSMRRTLKSWKGWTAKQMEIRWQRDWFDHRLRSDESEREKSDYIRMNPVRAGLVENAEAWPYFFFGETGWDG